MAAHTAAQRSLDAILDRLDAAEEDIDDIESTIGAAGEPFAVGSVFIAAVSTDPATLLGYGTWSAFGAGRVLVGLDSGDGAFDTVEETGGAKTVAAAGTNNAPAFTGSALGTHTHDVTATGTNANESTHTHSVTSNVTIATTADAAVGVGGGAANAARQAHTHVPTNNAVTSGAGSAHTHTFTGSAATSTATSGGTPAGTVAAPTFTGSATSVVQPYIVVYMWKRTA